jgi:hypothetical protein
MDFSLHQQTLDCSPGKRQTFNLLSSKQRPLTRFPLSPLLFIIVVETLSRKLEQEHVIGNLLGLQIA